MNIYVPEGAAKFTFLRQPPHHKQYWQFHSRLHYDVHSIHVLDRIFYETIAWHPDVYALRPVHV